MSEQPECNPPAARRTGGSEEGLDGFHDSREERTRGRSEVREGEEPSPCPPASIPAEMH